MTDFGDVVIGVGLVTLAVGAVFLFCVLGTIFGAFTGWVISITPLGVLVEDGFKVFGFNAQGYLVQIGAMLGFVTGFLHGLVKVEKKESKT